MPFVKLDCGILDSTIWDDRDTRDIFITALLMAEPYELTAPTPQIEVDSIEPTGWMVPVGWYGFVPAAGVGIIRRALADKDTGIVALRGLGAPEADSRSKDFEGRRLVRVDGGYIVLNFMKYRDKDHTSADRSRRYRERKKQAAEQEASRVTPSPSRGDITQAEAEAEADSEAESTTEVVVEKKKDVQEETDAYYRSCVVALNAAMVENLTVEGEWMPITASSQIDSVEWYEEGIPLEVAADVVRERCLAYRCKGERRGPRTLRYFNAAVREAWERGQMTSAEQRVQEAFK